ncbi:hypothetical protein CHRY9390_01731 [Chryseobacterium aquaeductus]|uniref:Fibronectin type-III domain-containing protein n=1 Tax=Chryseobacterium aquaeductus TaxID=2675056 RepID=A0A9N8MFX1_9FLAO|nr:fibronectin type III domain-containing protein [Chryseobacterium aquaeductus]CAA7331051.1 hypothetical protein CHRY9390_01731 [Chryseobacterium potabilaquae]CAD7807883.1 hypothetical protein CHRY9390_01731 [Chryseobacterium aquaeductus]
MKKIYQLSFRSKIDFLFKSLLIVAAIFAGVCSKVKAQVSAYSFVQSTGVFTPINGTVLGTATGNASATNLNSEVYPVTLPFSFIFNGTAYSSLTVSSNGFVSFGTTTPTTTNTTPISSTAAYDGSIAAFGRDLNSVFDVNSVTGNISWEVVGSAPNREVVIQWKDFRPTNVTVTTSVYTFSFQVRLQETSNVIKTVYTSGSYVVGNTSYASTAQIGLRGSANTDFNNRLNATTLEFVNSTAGTANSSTQAFNTVNAVPGMPSTGLTYTWTPPACFRPMVVTNPTSTVNSVNVQWVAPAPPPAGGYEIFYSTVNSDPTSSTTPLITGINATSTTIPSLNSSTTYYVWVRSVCSGSNKSEWSLSGIAKTLCAPNTSMFENFDSYATGSIVPDCWARIVGASNTAQSISATAPASGTRHISQTTSTAANATIVVLPEFSNVNAGTHWLRFKARVASGTGSLDIGYVTTITDASTFVNIQTLSIANTTYTSQDAEYTVTVPNTIPSNARLAIRNIGTSAVSHFFDDVYWEVKPTCIAPGNVSVSAITTTSATVQWNASVTPPSSGYEVYYSTSGTPPTSSTLPNVTGIAGLSTVISPLQPSSNYYVWVRSACSSSDKSNWSLALSFATQCGLISGAYSEDFENYPAVGNGASGGVLPNCWTNLGTAQGGHVSNSTSSVISGTNTLYLWTSGTTYVAYVALPPMSTLQSGDYRLKFDGKASVTAGGIIQLGYLDSSNAFVQLTTFSVPTTGTVYNFSFDIPALPTGVSQLALRNPGTPANSLSIDNLSYELKTLSTSEAAVKSIVRINPNPFSEVINIDKPDLVKSISIVDLSGKLVRNNIKAESVLRLNDLTAGIYLLLIEMKDGSRQSIKVIKK